MHYLTHTYSPFQCCECVRSLLGVFFSLRHLSLKETLMMTLGMSITSSAVVRCFVFHVSCACVCMGWGYWCACFSQWVLGTVLHSLAKANRKVFSMLESPHRLQPKGLWTGSRRYTKICVCVCMCVLRCFIPLGLYGSRTEHAKPHLHILDYHYNPCFVCFFRLQENDFAAYETALRTVAHRLGGFDADVSAASATTPVTRLQPASSNL